MMEIEQKHRIIWKNEFAKKDKIAHINRYLFLLELFKISVKKNNYISYDKYRDVSEYFDFSKNDIFSTTNYDRSFLFGQKYDTKHERELIRSYRKNIHHPKKDLENVIRFMIFFAILYFIFGLLFFFLFVFLLDNELLKTISFYLLFISGALFGIFIILKLYQKEILPPYYLTKKIFMIPDTFIENLEYEKRTIETILENYSELTQLESFNKFCSHLPETRIYFEVLIDNDYIEIKDKKIKYNSPCTQKVFAEILKDPVFIFSNNLSLIPSDVFKDLFGKTLNQMEQREQDTSKTDKYKKVKEVLIANKVPMPKK